MIYTIIMLLRKYIEWRIKVAFAKNGKTSGNKYTLDLMCRKPKHDEQQEKRSIILYNEQNKCFAIVTNSEGLSKTYDISAFHDSGKHRLDDLPWQSNANNTNPSFREKTNFVRWIISNCDHIPRQEQNSSLKY